MKDNDGENDFSLFPDTTEVTDADERLQILGEAGIPGLLTAYAPNDCCCVDRCPVTLPSFTVGRRSCNDFPVNDSRVSGTHFRIFVGSNGFMIEDMGSTNGTYMNGIRVVEPVSLRTAAIIRVGRCVFVFEPDAAPMLTVPPSKRYEMAGPFHTAQIVDALKEAVLDDRHILLVGETGVGKDLAAHAIAAMMREAGKSVAVLDHNCAQYTSEEEADSSLFGVGARVFSEVDSRAGLIENAGDGLLFLDEADFLPARIQKSLLRLIENRQYHRIGETKIRTSNAKFVFASNNISSPTHGLIHDLYPRLRVVEIPSLKNRLADIPDIFSTILKRSLRAAGLSETHFAEYLTVKHFEIMCLSGLGLYNLRDLSDNVRGLRDTAKRLTTGALTGKDRTRTVNDVFYERFLSGTPWSQEVQPPPPQAFGQRSETATPTYGLPQLSAPSHYELNKQLIIDIYNDKEQRLAPTVRALTSQGMSCTRQHLSRYLKKWGLRD